MKDDFRQEAELLLQSAKDLLLQAHDPATLRIADRLPDRIGQDAKPVAIAFAGAYSSGKSTLVSALTGRDDIAIGAGITTDTPIRIPWGDAVLIDTPGIHTEFRPQHDAQSYQALTEADLLVFVITNELFDDSLALHFHRLSANRDKATETLLVVNKMSRHYQGNTAGSQAVIKEDLVRILTPAQLDSIAFVDARDALTAASETDPARRARLLRRSNFDEFTHRIRCFISEASATAQQTTPLYMIERAVTDALGNADPEYDSRLRMTENRLRQQKDTVAEAIDRWAAAGAGFAGQAEEQIIRLQEEALQRYDATYQLTEADETEYATRVHGISDGLVQQLNASLHQLQQTTEQNVKDLWDDDLARTLMRGLESRVGSGALSSAITGTSRSLLSNLRQARLSATSAGLSGMSGSGMHQAVLNIGHRFGARFRPWQALKWARGANFALIGTTVILEAASQVWDDVQEAKRQQQMAEHRQEIAAKFQETASSLQEQAAQVIQETTQLWRESSVAPVDTAIAETVSLRESQREWLCQAEQLQDQARELIRRVHQQGS